MAKNRVAGAFDRSGRTRAALLDAARRVFADAGYLKAEIAQITRAAEVATGTFYVHFDNKLELLKAMVEQFQVGCARQRPEPPGATAGGRSAGAARALWRTHHRHAATFRALVEAATVHPEMATLYENMRHHARHDFHSMLAGAPRLADADRGELTVMAAAIENMVCACLYEWHALGKRPEGYTEERGFQSVLDIMLRVHRLRRICERCR